MQKIYRWLWIKGLNVLSSPCRLDFFDFEKIIAWVDVDSEKPNKNFTDWLVYF